MDESRNKYTSVNIWASWCEPYIKNFPEYEKLKKIYENQPINTVSISIDKNVANWKKSIKINNIDGYNLIDTNGIIEAYYKIQQVPFFINIKPDGSVADLKVAKPGSQQLYEMINNYLNGNDLKNK